MDCRSPCRLGKLVSLLMPKDNARKVSSTWPMLLQLNSAMETATDPRKPGMVAHPKAIAEARAVPTLARSMVRPRQRGASGLRAVDRRFPRARTTKATTKSGVWVQIKLGCLFGTISGLYSTPATLPETTSQRADCLSGCDLIHPSPVRSRTSVSDTAPTGTAQAEERTCLCPDLMTSNFDSRPCCF